MILPDLRFYRETCGIRNTCVAIAYLDIDNFKSFNTDLGESKVDANVLPVFMRLLEAFTYARGHAYREGGDEYVIVLPNSDEASAVRALDELRQRVERLKFSDVENRATISIGLCIVDPDCFLTDREAKQRAERAKKHAKDAGKNCVATYEGGLFREQDIRVVAPPERGAPAS